MPDDLAEPVVSAACLLFCRRAMGCGQHPAFPAPSVLSEGPFDQDSGAMRRKNDNSCRNMCVTIYSVIAYWIPAFAGMTAEIRHWQAGHAMVANRSLRGLRPLTFCRRHGVYRPCARSSALPVSGGTPFKRWPVRFSFSPIVEGRHPVWRPVRLSCVALPRQVCLRG
jgi:hypothetical protein